MHSMIDLLATLGGIVMGLLGITLAVVAIFGGTVRFQVQLHHGLKDLTSKDQSMEQGQASSKPKTTNVFDILMLIVAVAGLVIVAVVVLLHQGAAVYGIHEPHDFITG